METNDIDAATKAAIAVARMAPNQRREALATIGKRSVESRSAESFNAEADGLAAAYSGKLDATAKAQAAITREHGFTAKPATEDKLAVGNGFAGREALNALASRTVPTPVAKMQRPTDRRGATYHSREREDG